MPYLRTWEGPYATATLRFQISFPDSYPKLPPLVTFSTDMFHPLITPLSTYMYTAEGQDDGSVSATDVERLPPGGFSLRHGFPSWFARAGKTPTPTGDRKSSGQHSATQTPPRQSNASLSSGGDTSSSKPSTAGESLRSSETSTGEISTYEVLRYIRSTFNSEDVLDSIPLSAAGNPGAWHAWRTHRMDGGGPFPGMSTSGNSEEIADAAATDKKSPADRRPGEWNWEGVWEQRVEKAIAASLSEPVLYGGIGSTEDVVSSTPTAWWRFPVRAEF